MMQDQMKRVINDEFDTTSDENTVESVKDKLYKGDVEKMNEVKSHYQERGTRDLVPFYWITLIS